MNYLFFLYFSCCCCFFTIAIITLFKNNKDIKNRVFFIICLNLSFWALNLSLMTMTDRPETAILFRIIATVSWSTIYAQILYFVLLLVNKGKRLKKFTFQLLFFSPVFINLGLYLINPVGPNDLIKIPYGWAYTNPIGRGFIWNNFFTVYYVVYITFAIIYLMKWARNTKVLREKKQAKIIYVSFLIIMVLGSITDVIAPIFFDGVLPPLAIVFMLISVFGIWHAINKYGLMNISVDKVMSDVYKVMNEGVMVLKADNTIIDINKGAENILLISNKEMLNKKLSEEYFSNLYTAAKSEICFSEKVIKNGREQSIPILITSSFIRDRFNEVMGKVLFFQNISEIKEMQLKLENSNEYLELEVKKRTKELVLLNTQLTSEVKTRIEKEAEIKKLAFNDILTGLPNRRLFNIQLEQFIAKAKRRNNPIALLFLDLDGFKMINDSLGHDKGDLLLVKVAKRIKGIIRECDFTARFGGDEFYIIINDIKCATDVKSICQTLIDSIVEPFLLNDKEVHISASIGVAMYPTDGETVKVLVKNSDIAMYKAKHAGKGRTAFFDENMMVDIEEIMILTNGLYNACKQDELQLYYQPQVDVKTNEMTGFEALIRWNHPERGLLAPSKFINIAEMTGLIIPIGEWAIKTACNQLKKWQDKYNKKFTMAMNISIKQLQNNKLVTYIKRIIEEIGIEPACIEFEITESILIEDAKSIISILEDIRRLGVKITIDDFGADYSSLKYLKLLPVNSVKIDKTFIDGIGKNRNDELIIEAVVMLCKKLQYDVIAEGVEEKYQYEFLYKNNCQKIQGYYFYRPKAKYIIENLLQQSIEKSFKKDIE